MPGLSEEASAVWNEVSSNARIPRGIIPIDRYRWRIDRKNYDESEALVDSIFIASPLLASETFKEAQYSCKKFLSSIKQLRNVSCLPGIVQPCLGMPDLHMGYGFPIGCVAAVDVSNPAGVVSPGGVGFDINCGVRLIRTNIKATEAQKRSNKVLSKLATKLFNCIPSGVGSTAAVTLSEAEFKKACQLGMRWALEKGYCWAEDLDMCEEHGQFITADVCTLSKRAIKRGLQQLGTLGSGNHYLEVQVVHEIFDPEAAQLMGLEQGNICIMIHSGSRGLGHQVCTDALQVVASVGKDHLKKIKLPDKQLGSLLIESKEGKEYLSAMAAAANFAFVNRTLMTRNVREVFEEVFNEPAKDLDMHLVYDVAHNIAKFEEHIVDGEPIKVLVHRKGATRAFGPERIEVPEKYRAVGQPVLIGGSMGTCSYVLVGTQKAMEETFGSTCHGAGRALSRSEAKRELDSAKVIEDLIDRGIEVRIANKSGAAEEADGVYKSVNEVVNTCHESGISKKVARLKPLAVIKG